MTQETNAPTSPPAVETRQLTKRFGRLNAVEALDLRIEQGSLFGFIGPNGAGKTTTMRMLAGLETPTKGEVWLSGKRMDAERRPEVLRTVGYMPDFFGVYDDMRVWEYLDFFGRCYELSPERRADAITDLLDLVDLSGKRDAEVDSLSRGMKQRLCLAHALVHDPEILLLDEPASGLDPRARVEFREVVKELRAMGKTVVISSHILSELGEMCDAVGIMEKGRLVASGTLADIERGVHERQMVRVKVLSDLDAARELLGLEVPSAREEEPAEPIGAQGNGRVDGTGWLHVEIEGGDAERAAVLRRLVTAGVEIAAWIPVERDLEAVFLRATKGEVA
jgi:ABC-2 type transport system ATP-binding protein